MWAVGTKLSAVIARDPQIARTIAQVALLMSSSISLRFPAGSDIHVENTPLPQYDLRVMAAYWRRWEVAKETTLCAPTWIQVCTLACDHEHERSLKHMGIIIKCRLIIEQRECYAHVGCRNVTLSL